jgi:hypothetical protein
VDNVTSNMVLRPPSYLRWIASQAVAWGIVGVVIAGAVAYVSAEILPTAVPGYPDYLDPNVGYLLVVWGLLLLTVLITFVLTGGVVVWGVAAWCLWLHAPVLYRTRWLVGGVAGWLTGWALVLLFYVPPVVVLAMLAPIFLILLLPGAFVAGWLGGKVHLWLAGENNFPYSNWPRIVGYALGVGMVPVILLGPELIDSDQIIYPVLVVAFSGVLFGFVVATQLASSDVDVTVVPS